MSSCMKYDPNAMSLFNFQENFIIFDEDSYKIQIKLCKLQYLKKKICTKMGRDSTSVVTCVANCRPAHFLDVRPNFLTNFKILERFGAFV